VKLAGSAAHLTYCTNIHPGETWAEVRANVEQHVVAVKARVCPDAPFGVGLRLSARAAEELHQPEELARFASFLEDSGLYVFTINGFPYGAFHETRVKENVYLPDWRDPARGRYSACLAEILAALLPDGMTGSVSTVPGAFRSAAASTDDAARIAGAIVDHAAMLVRVRETTGKEITLALEPEPRCFLETSEEAVRFFEDHLFSPTARARLAAGSGQTSAQAETSLRRHLGICFDACHAAVEFEDGRASLAAIEGAGIAIAKIQITTALEANVDGPLRRELARFADDVYLHQVVVQHGSTLERYVDLPEALAKAKDGRWRIHFHVPVFQRELGSFTNTQPHLLDVLAAVRDRDVTRHLEIETYTWDVIPEAFRAGDAVSAIAREIEWTRAELERRSP
jgi:sugar phosphate isomerase/epimerase